MDEKKQIEEILNQIKEAILKHTAARYIYLFGSYAYGTPMFDSDIDIYVVIPDEEENLFQLYGAIFGELRQMEIYEIDLHLKRESKFNYRKTRSLFESTICQKGRLLYESA